MNLYSTARGISLDTEDIIEFVDTLSASEDFSRRDFDDFVGELLRKLKVTETHKIIASTRWKEIITTNFDTLLEKAFDEVIGTSDENLKLVPARSVSEYRYNQANDEVKYVKLNGCISDKNRFPLVFSTRDFAASKVFYKTALKALENLSPKITFLSVGFSYSDIFAKTLLQKFDKFNYRNRRWMINIDPYVQDARLGFFMDNRICVIKATTQQFFEEYRKWEADEHSNIVSRRNIKFTSRANKKISIPNKVAARIGDNLRQLSDFSTTIVISPEDFYRGEQPTYDVVRKNIDVVKSSLLSNLKNEIVRAFNKVNDVVPLVFLTGSYGTGKTTFCYRLIDEVTHDAELDSLAFEVIEANKLIGSDLEEVFRSSNSKNVMLFFNNIEVDSAFKALIDFRARLSTEQFQGFNVLILASIRENILCKHKHKKNHVNLTEINIDDPFVEPEAQELVEKLSAAGLLQYRDANERNKLATKIISKYSGDMLVSLISLVTNSHHTDYIRDAYSQLSPKAKEAFLYTSLLYRFGMSMPSGLLRSLISKTWEEFTEEILEYDSRGILIQEVKNNTGTDPDIYIRTKHAVIADHLVKMHLADADKRFEKYREVLRHINPSSHSAKLAVDLLKAIKTNDDLSQEKVDRLFDSCSQIFYEDPHFNLHYAINLQNRGDGNSLEKGIERIQHAQSFMENRSHRLIHRRAVLNFKLAQLTFKTENELNKTYRYIDEARSLFKVKLILDPFSSFSYTDYIRFEMWHLANVVLDEMETIKQRIVIEDLLDKAEKSVFESSQLITKLKAVYLRETNNRTVEEKKAYLTYLDEIYEDVEKRPYALILKFFHFDCARDESECTSIIHELESFKYLDEVSNVLFRYYGRNLHLVENRVKLFELTNNHPEIQQRDAVRYHYYLYVAEAYNYNFSYAYEHLNSIKGKFFHLNPELREIWRDAETLESETFEGIIKLSGKRKRVKIVDLQKSFDLRAGDYSSANFAENTKHKVHLHFYLSGIRAEIIQDAEISN